MISSTIATVLSALQTDMDHSNQTSNATNWFIEYFMQVNPSKFQFNFNEL